MKDENKYTALRVTAYEKRLVECDYIFLISEEDGGIEEAKRIIELIKEDPTAIDQLGYDEVEDLEIVQSEVVDSYPGHARVYTEEIVKKYPYLITEDGRVIEWYGEISEKRIIELLRKEWEALSDEEKKSRPWDNVKKNLRLEFVEGGNLIVCQAIKD